MQHPHQHSQQYTRSTCLEAAIGDIIRKTSNAEPYDSRTANLEPSLQNSYLYPQKADPTDASMTTYYESMNSAGTDEERTGGISGYLDPQFPNSDYAWQEEMSSVTNDTWLYETLYSIPKWNNINGSIPPSNPDRIVSSQLQSGLLAPGHPASAVTDVHNHHSGFSYNYSVPTLTADSGPNAERGFIYSTPLRPTVVEHNGRISNDFDPSQNQADGLCRLQPDNRPNPRERLPIRKQHQRVQDKIRTRALNTAFGQLRSCLPEIPKDTKLTKIRTLRTAITYIRQLMTILDEDEPSPRHTRLVIHKSHSKCAPITQSPADHSELRDSGYDSMFEKF